MLTASKHASNGMIKVGPSKLTICLEKRIWFVEANLIIGNYVHNIIFFNFKLSFPSTWSIQFSPSINLTNGGESGTTGQGWFRIRWEGGRCHWRSMWTWYGHVATIRSSRSLFQVLGVFGPTASLCHHPHPSFVLPVTRVKEEDKPNTSWFTEIPLGRGQPSEFWGAWIEGINETGWSSVVEEHVLPYHTREEWHLAEPWSIWWWENLGN